MKINLVMIVKNEERSLEKCLMCARPLVDEIIIADTGSTDRTKEIALGLGASVWDYVWQDDFSAARNFALEHSNAEWNLVLDADEYLLDGSREALEKRIHACSRKYGQAWIGSLLLHDYWMEDGRRETSFSWIPRLLPGGVRYTGSIHEQPEPAGPFLELPLEAEHDGYLQSGKGKRNLEYLRQAVEDNPGDMYYQFQMGLTLRNMKQPQESLVYFRKFYQNTGRQTGYWTEGVLLYLYALMDTGGADCLAEAFEIIQREQPFLGGRADFCFVCGLFYMKLVLSDVGAYIGYLPRIEASFLECLRIGEHPEQGGVMGTGSFKAAYNLGLWYEVSGELQRAVDYYKQSAVAGFEPAKERLKGLSHQK